MTKVIMTISTDIETKKIFAKYAKNMGTNMTNLLNMFMKNAPRSRKLEFFSPFEEVEPDEWEKEAINKYEQEKINNSLEKIHLTKDFFNQYK